MEYNEKYQIRPINDQDIAEIKKFTDLWIGTNYYSEQELKEALDLSTTDEGIVASLGAFSNNELVGVRLTFVPGKWLKKVRGLTAQLWKVDPEKVAYFKSLFIAEAHQANGLGKLLSNKSMEILKEIGGKAVLCHSWLESPNNSSIRYLNKMGFEKVNLHPLYWNPIDYDCTRCAPDRCQCTAAEMIKYF